MNDTKLDPNGYPLVSVIVRSMGRQELGEALRSIANQTYPNIEIVVVDARGTRELRLDTHAGKFPIRLALRDKPLLRAAAANAGIEDARGEYITFLDEDDFVDAEHIEQMALALIKQPQFLAAYCGLRVHFDSNQVSEFHIEFSRGRLFRSNFLNPQSVLWSRGLHEIGCRFDEELDIFEDWDFWLQIARHTEFLRVNSISGNWRAWIGQSGAGTGANLNAQRQGVFNQKIEAKWKNEAEAFRSKIRDLLLKAHERQLGHDLDGASAYIREALRLDPFDVNALNFFGMLELRGGRTENALSQLEKAIAEFSRSGQENAGLIFNLGLALEAAGRKDEAADKYAWALRVDPNFQNARKKLQRNAN